MPERFDPHNEKDDSDKPDKKSEKSSERRPWRPGSAAAEPKPWWHETAKPQIMPESEEVRRYAAERQARLVTGLSLENRDKDKKDAEEKTNPQRSDSEEPSIEPHEAASISPESQEEQAEPIVEKAASDTGAETNLEPTAEETEIAKQIAQEQLESQEAVEGDPVTDYLEKIVQEGNPAEAEQETIEEHQLDEVQAEADLLLWDLEDLLEKAAEKVGDRDLSDEEMLELAHEMAPEIEAAEPETQPDIEAFAPEPHRLPYTTPPDINRPDQRTLARPVQHGYRAPPVTPAFGSAGAPPVMPPSGGGGGGRGPLGGGANGLTAGALNPNVQAPGLRAAERIIISQEVRNPIFFKLLLAYYIGRHFGKKRGRAEAASELKPELEQQAKINKQQSADIMAGQKRIDALQRIKEAQEKETYDRERRERLTPPQKVSVPPSAEVPLQPPVETITPVAAAARSERAERERPPSLTPELIGERPHAERVSNLEPEPAQRPEKANVIGKESNAQPRSEEITTTPERSVGRISRPETQEVPSIPSVQETVFTSAEPYQPQQPPEVRPQTIETTPFRPVSEMPSAEEASLYVPLAPVERASGIPEEAIKSAEAPKTETSDTETPFGRLRPEIPTHTPGLEAPSPSGPPEALTPSIGAEPAPEHAPRVPARPEAFDAGAVAEMNLPELITVAKEMTVGGENLGQMFQERQIDATGLRRVAAEYARGAHPEDILDQERRLKEVRSQSPEFLHSQTAGPPTGGVSGGGGAGLFAQAAQKTDHLLPAYDHEQYPSDTPQHLLPAYDQETTVKRQHRTVAIASALIGLGAGIILGLVLF